MSLTKIMAGIEKETDVRVQNLKSQSPERSEEGASTSSPDPDEVAAETIHTKPQQKWTSYIWDTFDKPPAERRFLFKLDSALLTFATLGYFIKYLDQNNISNAFVSGMKEDLGMYQNQLNYMQTCWTVGYVIGEIPCKRLRI